MPKTAKILLYGVIGDDGWWSGTDNSDLRFNREIDALISDESVDQINIHINSPGGYVHDGLAIANAIFRCEKPVHAYIDGIAYSMGSIIALAADKIIMPSNGLFMMHNVSGGAWGNAKALRSSAETIDKYDTALANTIAEKSGLSVEEVLQKWMNYEDHFFTAQEALDAGLIDEIEAKEVEVPEEATDTTNYNFMKLAACYKHDPTPDNKGILKKFENTFNKKITEFKALITSSNPQKSNTESMKVKASLIGLLAFFGFKTEDLKDKQEIEFTPTEEQLQNLESELSTAQENKDKVTQLEAQVQNLTSERDTLKEEVKNLGGKGAGNPTPGAQNGDDPHKSGEGEYEFMTSADREALELLNP